MKYQKTVNGFHDFHVDIVNQNQVSSFDNKDKVDSRMSKWVNKLNEMPDELLTEEELSEIASKHKNTFKDHKAFVESLVEDGDLGQYNLDKEVLAKIAEGLSEDLFK